MSDIVERLRRWQELETAGIHGEAADTIEALLRERDEYKAKAEYYERINGEQGKLLDDALAREHRVRQGLNEVVATTDEDGRAVCVTRQDEEGRILSVIWEADEDEVERLRQVCRNVYEVWAGSEGIPEPKTCPEAYLIQLIEQMRDAAKEGLK